MLENRPKTIFGKKVVFGLLWKKSRFWSNRPKTIFGKKVDLLFLMCGKTSTHEHTVACMWTVEHCRPSANDPPTKPYYERATVLLPPRGLDKMMLKISHPA
jgi:hypothetical protein